MSTINYGWETYDMNALFDFDATYSDASNALPVQQDGNLHQENPWVDDLGYTMEFGYISENPLEEATTSSFSAGVIGSTEGMCVPLLPGIPPWQFNGQQASPSEKTNTQTEATSGIWSLSPPDLTWASSSTDPGFIIPGFDMYESQEPPRLGAHHMASTATTGHDTPKPTQRKRAKTKSLARRCRAPLTEQERVAREKVAKVVPCVIDGKETLQCPVCRTTTMCKRGDLERHVQSHLLHLRPKCERCNCFFSRKDSRKRHYDSHPECNPMATS